MLTADYLVVTASLVLSTFCWWAIRHSGHGMLLKISLTFLAAIPFVGPFIYLFAHRPQRPAVKESAVLRKWNEHEHLYLGAASLLFWGLAVLAYWMNDWRPGAIRQAPFNLGFHADVDRIFFALLIGAVITFALAIRAKAILLRKLREAPGLLLEKAERRS